MSSTGIGFIPALASILLACLRDCIARVMLLHWTIAVGSNPKCLASIDSQSVDTGTGAPIGRTLPSPPSFLKALASVEMETSNIQQHMEMGSV